PWPSGATSPIRVHRQIAWPGNSPLHIDRASHGVFGTAKLNHYAVAGWFFNNAAVMFLDLRIDQVVAKQLDARQRPFLVHRQQPRTIGDVCRENGDQFALGLLVPWLAPPTDELQKRLTRCIWGWGVNRGQANSSISAHQPTTAVPSCSWSWDKSS